MTARGKKALRKLLFNISTLEDLGEVLSSENEFRDNLRISLYSVMGSLPVSKGALFLYRPKRRALVLEVSRGLDLPRQMRISLPDRAADLLRRRRRAIGVQEPPSRLASMVRNASEPLALLRASLLVPLRFRDELVGAMTLGPKFSGGEFGEDDFELITVMANYIAIGIHNQSLLMDVETSNRVLREKVTENRKLYRNLERIYNDTIRALGAAIDAKDPYTRGHSDRVAHYSVAIAKRLGLSRGDIKAVRVASHLHDIGKIAVDNSVLLKPGRLNEREFDQISRHPMVSFDILSNIKFPYPDVALIAKHHHEKVNGGGYPDQVMGDDLTTNTKIIALADAFDAMTSDRPYRPALDLEVALKEVRNNMGLQFDRGVTQTFFDILAEEVGGGGGQGGILPLVRSRFVPKKVLSLLRTKGGGGVPRPS